MVATGGFGAFPNNPLTQTFQEVIGEAVPAEFLTPFNSFMDLISAPRIQPKPDSVSTNESTLDPIGMLEEWLTVDTPTAIPQETVELVNFETAVALIGETQTQIAITQDAFTFTPPATQTQTFTSVPTLTFSPTSTQSSTPTSTVVWIYVSPTKTPKPKPANTSTPSPTGTPPGATEGSCVSSSPDTSTYGCQVSNIRLDGVVQSSLYVDVPSQTFTLQYDYQTWSDPGCPTCTLQLIAGMESNPASTCDYGSAPGAYPGASGTSLVHNLTAPSSSGTWAVFIRWYRTPTCDTSGYDGFGTVIANVIVP